MILRQYGNWYHSVQPNLNSRALTEVGFLRDQVFSITVEEFDAGYEKLDEKPFAPETEGEVLHEAEEELLNALKVGVVEAMEALREGEILVVENRESKDRPKTRDTRRHVVVDGESRLRFFWRIDPPLRLGVYRKKA